MKKWDIDFITEDQFRQHVAETIRKYGDSLISYDLRKFNSNIIDPIKLIFDRSVYGASWEEIISNEIFRQRDKSNNNSIGYFHQHMFKMIDKCEVPEAGWDVIYRNAGAIKFEGCEPVSTVYVEMKNKHNTMNSSSSAKTYIKAQNQLLQDDDCVCCLVKRITKRSQNTIWKAKVDGVNVSHRRIRRLSIDQFYTLVTGDDKAFFKICMALPEAINEVTKGSGNVDIPEDTVYKELKDKAEKLNLDDNELAIAIAVYLLGFSSYSGFNDIANEVE